MGLKVCVCLKKKLREAIISTFFFTREKEPVSCIRYFALHTRKSLEMFVQRRAVRFRFPSYECRKRDNF